MVKAELIRRVAKETGIPKATVARVLETILSEIVNGIISDGSTVIRGFGTFAVKTTRPKVGWNFSKGENMEVSGKKIPVFTPSDSLKQYVEESVK